MFLGDFNKNLWIEMIPFIYTTIDDDGCGELVSFMCSLSWKINQNIKLRTTTNENVLRDCINTSSTFTTNTDEKVVTDFRNGSSQATLVLKII